MPDATWPERRLRIYEDGEMLVDIDDPSTYRVIAAGTLADPDALHRLLADIAADRLVIAGSRRPPWAANRPVGDTEREMQSGRPTVTAVPLSIGRHPDELALLRVLRDAGPTGLSARQIARHLREPGLGSWIGGRLRVLARHQLVAALPHDPDKPARWIATLPANHPAATGRAPEPPPSRTWTRERAKQAIREWTAIHGRPPTYEQWRRSGPGRPCATTVTNLFDGWSAAIRDVR